MQSRCCACWLLLHDLLDRHHDAPKRAPPTKTNACIWPRSRCAYTLRGRLAAGLPLLSFVAALPCAFCRAVRVGRDGDAHNQVLMHGCVTVAVAAPALLVASGAHPRVGDKVIFALPPATRSEAWPSATTTSTEVLRTCSPCPQSRPPSLHSFWGFAPLPLLSLL